MSNLVPPVVTPPAGDPADRRWVVTPSQAVLAAIVFGFVGWMIDRGYTPYTSVTTAAVTLGMVAAVIVLPRTFAALGNLARKLAAASSTERI